MPLWQNLPYFWWQLGSIPRYAEFQIRHIFNIILKKAQYGTQFANNCIFATLAKFDKWWFWIIYILPKPFLNFRNTGKMYFIE